MHNKNFAFLSQRLEATGFGLSLHELLRTKIHHLLPAFVLPHLACFGRDELAVILFVKKWKEADMYYFHKYHAVLWCQDTGEVRSRDFHFSHTDPEITLPEAYDLLKGRAVFREKWSHREKVTYRAWLQLDFARTDSCGNFQWHTYNENPMQMAHV